MTSAVATSAVSRRRARATALRLGTRRPRRSRAASSRPLQGAQAGEAHAEERAAPLREERLDQLDVARLEREADLGGDVTGLGEGRDELGVQRLAARRGLDADRELGARMQAVLELRQLVEEAVRDAFGGRLGDALEPHERSPLRAPRDVETALA